MGLVTVKAKVIGPGGKSQRLDFLVDSGATYTLLPRPVWRRLGLKPMDSIELSLADGTVVKRDLSECQFELTKGKRHSPVLLGEEGDEALLGVLTLEIFGLIINPLNRRLQPMRMVLA